MEPGCFLGGSHPRVPASLRAQYLVKVTSHLAAGDEDYSLAASWLKEMPICSVSSPVYLISISYCIMLAAEG